MSEKQAKSVWSDLWLKEDYWAIWLGKSLTPTNKPDGVSSGESATPVRGRLTAPR
ncbi:MAG: hypothetical protein V2J65_37040 [Desulfobacteraceae bacterium]|nr:hypothetical protein [Desulfobacteraceae bacterium]